MRRISFGSVSGSQMRRLPMPACGMFSRIFTLSCWMALRSSSESSNRYQFRAAGIGGYHATSHTRCYLAFTGLALICILLSKVIAANHLFRIITTAALLGISIFFSPIEAKNKPLGKKKRLSYKMVASVLSLIDFLLAIFNVLPDTRSITVYYLSKWVLVIFSIIPFF